MLKSSPLWNRNPYLYTSLATFGYIAAISIVKYVRGQQFFITEILLGAVIFWIIFFLVNRWLSKRIEKKRSKK